jgi:hypothetical protein
MGGVGDGAREMAGLIPVNNTGFLVALPPAQTVRITDLDDIVIHSHGDGAKNTAVSGESWSGKVSGRAAWLSLYTFPQRIFPIH